MRAWPNRPYGGFGTINGGTPRARHVCAWCDHTWPYADCYAWWPIRLKWGAGMSSRWFYWHGWELSGRDRLWRRWLGWTFHLGRLKVIFGPRWQHRRAVDRLACPNCDTTAWERPA